MFEFLKNHGTKVLGFIGATVGVLAVADPELVGGPTAIKYFLLVQSLLTVWRGFINSGYQDAAAKKDAGFARIGMLTLLVSVFGLLALALSGCTGTRAAYKQAQGVDKQAYVAVEHYAALVKEAADLAAKPTTPRSAVDALKRADAAALPVVRRVRELRDAYLAVKSADNEVALQEAVNDAILLIADMVRAVKHARGES